MANNTPRRRTQVNLSMPAELATLLDSRAAASNVTRAAYCLAVLAAHLTGEPLDVSERPRGLAAAGSAAARRAGRKGAKSRWQRKRASDSTS